MRFALQPMRRAVKIMKMKLKEKTDEQKKSSKKPRIREDSLVGNNRK